MLRAAPGPVFLLALVASVARADPILYATAATTGEITSYCIGPQGAVFPSPKQRITTLGNAPSRLITATLPGGRFLYAGENDRVEVYRIADGGFLTRVGRIPAQPIPDQPGNGLTGMNPHDLSIATAADGTPTLYVPQRSFDRLASFPLDPATGLSTVPTGVCTSSTGCKSTSECASGQACVADHCVDGSLQCTTPADCASGQTCRDGVCVDICMTGVVSQCSDTADTCSPTSGQTGVCTTSTPCSSTAECTSGQACVAGHCVDGSGPCTTADECGTGQTCEGGVCAATCTPGAAGRPCGSTTADTCTPISDQTGASCVLGPIPSDWEDVETSSGLLYSTRAVSRGETFVYQLASNGNFADGVVTVSRSIGPETNPTQCPRMRGCSTDTTCFTDAGCATGQRCVSGACIDLSGSECTKNKDCPSGQQCVAFSPCNQNGKMYVAPSANCADGVVLTDDSGQPITPPATANNPSPSPITVRGQIEPYSRRRRLNGAAALALNKAETPTLLYVSERFRKAISVFSLCPAGGQPPICPDDTTKGEKGEPCTCPDANQDGVPDVPDLCPPGGFSVDARENVDGICTARNRQKRLEDGGRTRSNIRYNAMVLTEGSNRSTILGSQFLDGRLDGYLLRSDGGLPRQPKRSTKANFRTSPFRLFFYRPADLSPAESAGVVYVGAGDIDRVQGYRLDRNGLPKDKTPFSETDTLRDTFPNDVTVAELPGSCR